MKRFLAHHGLQVLLGAGIAAAAVAAHQNLIFVDNFGVVREGRLYRCRQPRGRQWGLLARHGITTVVNLRTEAEDPAELARERRACALAGAELLHLPVAGLMPNDVQIERFLATARAAAGAVLVHCKHGEDRTGVMVAAYRVVVEGWPVRKALAEKNRYRGRTRAAKRARVRQLLNRLRSNRRLWLQRTAPKNTRDSTTTRPKRTAWFKSRPTRRA